MTGQIDFTNCRQIPGRAYNGALKRIYGRVDMVKIRAFINNVPYI